MSTKPTEVTAPDWTKRRFVYFKGQFDTRINTGEDYPTQFLAKIFNMVPGSKPKGAGLAMIPSAYHDYDAREHAAQRERGQYLALTGDVDKGNHGIDAIRAMVTDFAGDAAWFIYSSPHARPGDMRWRVIIPLADEVPFDTWHDAQCAFYAFSGARGIAMDYALARAAQPVYLPNVPAVHSSSETPLRGEDGKPLYYTTATTGINAPGLPLDTGPVAQGIAALRRQRIEDEQARERIKREAEARRASMPRGDNASLIDDFNAENSVATMLEMCGYQQCPRHPEDWRSPHQTGETYATRIMGSKWVSLSGSDAAANLGEKFGTNDPGCSGCFGDAYDLFVHYKHGGDHKSAYRQLGAERRAAAGPNVVQFPQAEPPEWMREIPPPDEAPEWGDVEPFFVPDTEHDPDDDTFRLLNLAELEALPPPNWLIHEVISEDGLSIMYGDPGTGKSFIALDMSLRVAMGLDWQGRSTRQVGVLYIAGEGARGLGKRVKGWRMKHQADWENVPFMLLPVAVQLLDERERARLFRTIDEAKRKAGFDIGLVVIDTISRSIAGQDENGQDTMSGLVKIVDDVRHYCGGAALGVHHSGKDKDRGMRGSTVLLGACDATIRLTKDGEHITVKCEKQKDAEEFQPIYMRLEQLRWTTEQGEELSTLIPMSAAPPADDSLSRAVIDQAFNAIAEAWHDGRPLSNKHQSRNDGRYAPSIFTKRLGGSEKAWRDHIEAWLESGHLSVEEFDRRNKKFGLRVLKMIQWGDF